MILAAGVAFVLVKTFSPVSTEPIGKSAEPKDCFEIIPADINGLLILEGSRSKASIIRDMVPVVCAGEALFAQMQQSGDAIKPGTATFEVKVEFNGEVVSANMLETTIQSNAFLNKIRRFILEKDFAPWDREDTDTLFIYPASFGTR